MKRRPPLAGLLSLLCLIALLGAQVFGGVRGYVCNNAGTLEWAVVDPCSGEEDKDEPVDHELVRDDVQIRLLRAQEAPAIVPTVVAVLHDEWNGFLPNEAPVYPAAADLGAGPPRGVAVARTVVLLI